MKKRWQIELLGGLSVRNAERVISRFRSRTTGSLLAYLALHSDQRHPREVLVELLWPECDYRTGLSRLSTAVWALRRELESPDEPGTLVVTNRHSVGLNPAAVETDVAAFEAAVRAGRASQGDERLPKLTQAIELYRGEFLPGYYEDWVIAEQRRLAELYHEALSGVLSALEREGRLDEATEHACRGLERDPLREEIHRALMRFHLAAGHPEQALRQYVALRDLLKRELGAPPSPETRTVARQAKELIEAPARRVAPGLRPTPPPSARLPSALTRFIGRHDELAALCRLLTEDSARLVTVTGLGGTGKTRLALETAQALADWFQGNVWFAELAGLIDPERIAETVLQTVAPGGQVSGDVLGGLIGALGDGTGLLVLDNLEHLLPQGGELCQDLLVRLPELRCLVTSRQRLGMLGERTFPLGPLPSPQPDASFDSLPACPSVELLVDRATAVSPDFSLSPDNAGAVAALCRDLEGIPLSLELAAARLATMTPEQMVTGLSDRFGLLVTNDNCRARRHHSVRAAMGYSLEQLSSQRRRFLASLSVFRGGWTVDTAGEVSGEPRAEEWLAELRDASLVVPESRGADMRFRMLETVRELAAEQLGEATTKRLRDRHARHYRELARWAEAELDGPGQQQCLSRLDAELDNLRAALAWAVESHPVWAMETAVDLGHFWEVRGRLAEGRDWLERALTAAPRAPFKPRVRAMLQAGWLSFLMGDGDHAEARQTEGLGLCRREGDVALAASALYSLANLAFARGRLDESEGFYQESLDDGREIDSPPVTMRGLEGLANVAEARGDLAQAHKLHRESLALKRVHGSARSVAYALRSLGQVEERQENWQSAQRLYREGLDLFRELGDDRSAATARASLGRLALRTGDLPTARAELEPALTALREAGSNLDLAEALFDFAEVVAAEGDCAGARGCFEECLRIRGHLGETPRMGAVLERLAAVAERQGEPAAAVRYLAASAHVRERSGTTASDEESALAARLQRQMAPGAFAIAWAQGAGLLDECLG